MPDMITGTAGVSPLRLLRPAHGPDHTRLRGLGWTGAGRDLVSPPSVFRVHVSGPTGEVTGVAARFEVSDPPHREGLLPHERTDERAVRRRLRALRSAHVDRDPLLLTYRGAGRVPALVGERAGELWEHTDPNGQQVRVEQVDADVAPDVLAVLGGARLLVADGHHRLAASVALAGEGVPAHVTGLVVDADDSPFRLGPIHRVLLDEDGREQLPEDAATALLDRSARAGAHVTALDGADDPVGAGGDADSGHPVVVVHRERRWAVSWPGHPSTDVTSLVEHVLDDEQGTRTRREPALGEALDAARRGAVAVVLPAPSLDEVLGLAARGALLPYKATAFEPKVPTGVLVRPMPAWYAEHGSQVGTG
jgi:hypothetical protein